jgi:hypothetical protein
MSKNSIETKALDEGEIKAKDYKWSIGIVLLYVDYLGVD